MPVDLRETRLPGVGVKYAFRTANGGRLSVILHNDGQREIYYYRRADDDEPTAVIELHDDEARQLGAIIGGAYERPKIVEELEMALGELHIEWIPVPDTSPAIGLTLADARLRARTGRDRDRDSARAGACEWRPAGRHRATKRHARRAWARPVSLSSSGVCSPRGRSTSGPASADLAPSDSLSLGGSLARARRSRVGRRR